MNSFIEKEKILTFRKKSFDVSNVSVERIEKMTPVWDKEVSRKDFTNTSINKMSEKVGLYLIRQDLSTLMFRMTFWEAIKTYILRYLLTVKNIRKSNKAEYEEFQSWVLFTMTGKKKDLLEVETNMMESSSQIVKNLMDQGYSLELCQESLLILLKDLTKRGETSESIQAQS